MEERDNLRTREEFIQYCNSKGVHLQMTRTQSELVDMMLKEQELLSRIGNLEPIMLIVYKFLKS